MKRDHWPNGVQRYRYVDKMLKPLNIACNPFQNHRPHGADTFHCQWKSGRWKSLFSSKFTVWSLQNVTWGDLHVCSLGWWLMGILLHPASSSFPPPTFHLGSLLHTSGQCPTGILFAPIPAKSHPSGWPWNNTFPPTLGFYCKKMKSQIPTKIRRFWWCDQNL